LTPVVGKILLGSWLPTFCLSRHNEETSISRNADALEYENNKSFRVPKDVFGYKHANHSQSPSEYWSIALVIHAILSLSFVSCLVTSDNVFRCMLLYSYNNMHRNSLRMWVTFNHKDTNTFTGASLDHKSKRY